MRIAVLTVLAMAAFLPGACGGRIEESGGTGDGAAPDGGAAGSSTSSTSTLDGSASDSSTSQSACPGFITDLCECPAGGLCVARPQSGGVAYLGCVATPPSCGGTASCDCMGCVCEALGLHCAAVLPPPSSNAPTVLQCL
jgi:hypothetical protein